MVGKTDFMNKKNDKELSPCVRNCCLDNNDVCLGCYRTLAEIVAWQKQSRAQQQAILIQCDVRKLAATKPSQTKNK